jgi:hypothetical protein
VTPEPDTGFAERVRTLCPRFRATETLPARKSELLAGDIDGVAVVAKRLAKPNDVWAWYLAREIAIYRAFAAEPPPVRVPALHAAGDDFLVIDRVAGAPIARRRNPLAELDDGVLHELLAILDRIATWRIALPSEPPHSSVLAQLRTRFLEDPTAPVEWIRDGISRSAHRELIATRAAAKILSTIDDDIAPSHGDVLLRNAIIDGGNITFVDWECAGPHHVDWDLALLWTQLHPSKRPIVEAAARSRAFFGIVAFALCREIAILRAFRGDTTHFDRELAEVLERVG